MRIRISALALALAILLTLASCSSEPEPEPIVVQSFALDTVVSVTLYDGTQEDADDALRLIDELGARYDRYDPESLIAQYNRNDGGETNSAEGFFNLFELSKELHKLTDGAFDPAIGRLTELWNFKTATQPPTDEQIAEALAQSGLDKVSRELKKSVNTNSTNHSPQELKLGGTQLDFGGIAKGEIGECVRGALRDRGVGRALINLGGNITTLRAKDDDKPFKIGIQDPFGDGGDIIGYVEVGERTVSTSGVYQRYFEYEGVKYHHILDPRTGRPADSGIVSATVICNYGPTADALATAFVVLGEEKSLELVDELIDTQPSRTDEIGIYAILVREDGTVAFSRGAEDIFTPTK